MTPMNFDNGEIVLVPGNIKGEVIDWGITPEGICEYKVQFIDKTLIPRWMWYPEHYIKKNRAIRNSGKCECGLGDKKVPNHAHFPYCPKFRRDK